MFKRVTPILVSTFLCSSLLPAATIATYVFDGNGVGTVDPAFSGVVNAGVYDTRTAALGNDGSGNTITGFSNQNDNVYMRASGTGTSSLASSGTNAYHTFSFEVTGLGANEVLDLTDISFQYQATGTVAGTAFYNSFYADTVGFDDANRLGNQFLSPGTTLSTVQTIDLTSNNIAAGAAFTGLTNGASIEFRIYFGDDSGNTNSIQRIGGTTQGLIISGDVSVVPEPETYALALGVVAAGALILRRRRR